MCAGDDHGSYIGSVSTQERKEQKTERGRDLIQTYDGFFLKQEQSVQPYHTSINEDP